MPPLVVSVWAAIFVVPLLVAFWDAARVDRDVAKAEHLAQDFIALRANGDFERAASRCREIGGALGQGVAGLLDARRHGQPVSQPALLEMAGSLAYPRALGCIGLFVLVVGPVAVVAPLMQVETWPIATIVVLPICAFAYLANRAGQAERVMLEALRRIDQAAAPPGHPGPIQKNPTGLEPRP